MEHSFVPLLVAAGAFLALLVWRVRPLAPWGTRRRASLEALREARSRVESALDDKEKARALCDAADLLVGRVRGWRNARGLYQRAMRVDPESIEVIERAISGLERRPRALESLLWRQLATGPWDQSAATTVVVLDALQTLYRGPLRNAVRARALQNARVLLQ